MSKRGLKRMSSAERFALDKELKALAEAGEATRAQINTMTRIWEIQMAEQGHQVPSSYVRFEGFLDPNLSHSICSTS